MNIAYVRVSTIEQNEARQLEGLEKFKIDKWFSEKVSAKNTNRPQLNEMLEFAREGDTIFIHDFSRLARSTSDLLKLVEQMTTKGIHLVSNKENIPHAVLIRGLTATEGLETIAQRLKITDLSKYKLNGPGKLSKALGIHYSQSGINLYGSTIWIEDRGLNINEKKSFFSSFSYCLGFNLISSRLCNNIFRPD